MSNEKDWDNFKQKLFAKSTINLNDYKPNQMQRRIGNLMTRHGATSYMAFFDMIDLHNEIKKRLLPLLPIVKSTRAKPRKPSKKEGAR